MKNKVLSKVMMTVALIFCSMFLLAACSWQKDVNLTSIEVMEGTIPESIYVGEFDNAGIKLVLTYDDDSTEQVPVTSQMVPDEYKSCLTTPGIYQIEILFKGFTTEICVNIVSDNIYVVNFYNALGRLISRQYVEKGKDAVAPADTYFAMDGYSFIGWDRTYTNVNENIDVYGIYIKVENALTNENIYNKLLNAYEYMRVNNYIFTLATEDSYVTINYHYNKQGNISTSQTIARYSENDSFSVTNCLEDYYEYYEQGINPHYQKNYYSEVFGDNESGKMETIMMGGLESVSLLSNEKTQYSSYSYVLTNNTNIYTVVCVLKLNTINEEIYLNVKFIFDDERMLTIERYYDNGDDSSKYIEKIDFEYTTIEFDETLIPEEVKTANY